MAEANSTRFDYRISECGVLADELTAILECAKSELENPSMGDADRLRVSSVIDHVLKSMIQLSKDLDIIEVDMMRQLEPSAA